MTSLGKRIKELRMKMGLNQVELAQGICTPSMISQIESERARPSYKILFQLAERLEVPFERLISAVELNLETVSTYKMAKAMVAAKEYATAIPLLEKALESRKNSIPKATIQYDLAECYLQTGQLSEAEVLFLEVQDFAIIRQDIHMIVQTYHSLGQIAAKRKQFQLADHLFKKALDQVAKMEPEDIYLKAGILIHLGYAHESLGHVSKSVDYYTQASSLFEHLGNFHDIAKTYMKLGQSYKELNDVEKATEYSERAISIYAAIDNIYTSVQAQVHTATLFGQMGKEKEAVQMFQQAVQKFVELGKNEDVGTTYVQLAKLQLCMGLLEEAKVSCRIARSSLPELHLYQAWVNRTLGQIEWQRGKQDEAIRRLQMAADSFRYHGKVGEWAETMTDVSRLKVEANDTDAAIEIMFEVRLQTQQSLSERGIVI